MTQIARTVVNVFFAVFASKTSGAAAFVLQRVNLLAYTIVLTWRRITREILAFAVHSRVTWLAEARVRSMGVKTGPVSTRFRMALYDVLRASMSSESRGALALETVLDRRASRPVFTRVVRTMVLGFAMTSSETRGAGAGVLFEALKTASPSVEARTAVAGIGDWDFTERRRIADGTGTPEARGSVMR